MAAPLKDNISAATASLLGERLRRVHPTFAADALVAAVGDRLDELELKDRINLLADEIAARLPPFPAAAAVLVDAVAEPIDEWACWPLCSVVERHGVAHPEASLAAMPALTVRFSCEFAIRPFLDAHLELTRGHLRRWAGHEHEAVRRLVSEGTRPRLPWGPKVAALVDDPTIGLELLELLRTDGSEFVRRSVANHLNDISRPEPELVVETLARWSAEPDPVDPWVVRHALRTLVKQGHPGAMALLGFSTEPKVEVASFSCEPAVLDIGESIELTATIVSTAAGPQRLVADFVVHHVNANGETSPKVFKWTTIATAPGSRTTITKTRRIQHASTRTYHPGVHVIELQLAGQRVATTEFDLRV